MKKLSTIFFALFFIFTFCLIPETIEERIDNLTKAEMQSVVEFLSHDLIEGRAPGTRGGNISELYMKTLFKFMDLQPGENGKYLQPFKLKGFNTQELQLTANGVTLDYFEDIMGSYPRSEEEFELEAEAVFVGFGIIAPLWKWDDYNGVDVRDKFVITRVNDPGL